MKKFLMIVLPPLVVFGVFALVIRLDRYYHEIRFELISEGTMHSLMAYFFFFWPLLLIDAVLTQLLITIPLWRWLKHKSRATKIGAISIWTLICLIFSLAVSYAMWGSMDYFDQWMKSCFVMMMVQLFYWLVVILTLYFVDHNPKLNQPPTPSDRVSPEL